MRKIGSKNFCSALVSNGKDGKVVVATDEIRPVVEQRIWSPVDERGSCSCNWPKNCATSESSTDGSWIQTSYCSECTGTNESPSKEAGGWSLRQATSASLKSDC